ncbi:methyltransferase [Shewanella sp. OMA3-2]|uniref:methyltransferase n=1 Tax=Shewanella sp. OMA3-2 TaxID=2908650 RepID=UPI001F23238C|nr:methyltransferase [Shewanella sp. OMA3-2]UJF23231.1 SAM-dependent methyltransferase [Shewanella sp. OMA3-2]
MTQQVQISQQDSALTQSAASPQKEVIKQDYATRLGELSTLLRLTQPLWQVVAFDCKHLPWQQAFPTLAAKLWHIPDADIDLIDSNPSLLLSRLLPALQQDFQAAKQQQTLSLLPLLKCHAYELAAKINQPIDESSLKHFRGHIKGRKWQQIMAFTERVFAEQIADYTDTDNNDHLPVLEWCAGKGHLGRLIAKTQQRSVTSLEWQQDLCEQGQSFAEQWQLDQQFICADAFADVGVKRSPITSKQHAVALHACGDLHVRLLRLASEAGTQIISISPCCYHLIQDSHYQALSSTAKQAELSLSRHDLQLPLQQSVIANQKHNALRQQEIAWRLGFDSLQRMVRQTDQYLPVPTIKQSQLAGKFSDFCFWAAAQKNISIPSDTIFDDYLQQGVTRQKLTQRIDLVRHLFRQAIEQWLLLDRVCFLTEQGYKVTLTQFCPTEVTPRNALIHAHKTHLV